MKYTSNAEWPRMDAYIGNARITSDVHETKELAQSVCNILEREGYGGERKMFPVKTWVEEIHSTDKEP